MTDLNFTNPSNIQSLEVVDRVIETQLQVTEKFKFIGLVMIERNYYVSDHMSQCILKYKTVITFCTMIYIISEYMLFKIIA